MSLQPMKVSGCPTNTLEYRNRALISCNDPLAAHRHIEIKNRSNESFIFTLLSLNHPNIKSGFLGFNLAMRVWASASFEHEIQARPFEFDLEKQSIAKITFNVKYLDERFKEEYTLNSSDLAQIFFRHFIGQAFTHGQTIGFRFPSSAFNDTLKLTVKEMEALNPNFEGGSDTASQKITLGCTIQNTRVIFEKSPDSCIQFVGNGIGYVETAL